ncbi:hypothetical protein [Lentibacillus saliphilus]|uniref:hypothetical protein n=1 Tax=Lentibacillus saliphilus TaxID=2737028 RepID=UPI001C2FE527|nr:hypothetical protein [Lentibacillus saliphilus]
MEQERELQWDDEIEKDGGDYILLPAGDYNFTVTKFERGRFQGSAKMPACNQAKLELTVHSQEHGDVVIFHNLLLHTKTEGLLSNFFTGIGQKKKGEKLRMNWNTVIGSKGKLQLEINKFVGRDGEERTNNQVKKFYPYEEAFPQGQSQGYQQQVQQQQAPFPTNTQQQGGFIPGQF